jgi:AcrR family transcriptional regulator
MSKSERTREAILQAATELFLKSEYDAVKLTDIGRKAGFTHAALYEHFADKEALFLAACERIFALCRDYVDARIDQKGSAEKRLEGHIVANVELYHDYPERLVSLGSTLYLAMFNSKFRQLQQRLHESTVSRYEVLLCHGNHEGAWEVSDPRTTAHAIHGLMFGEAFKTLVNPDAITAKSRARFLIEQVNKLIQDHKAPGAKPRRPARRSGA